MTTEQKAYLQALSDVRSWHRWQFGQVLGDFRAMQTHDDAIATKKRHAVEDEAERRRGQAMRHSTALE